MVIDRSGSMLGATPGPSTAIADTKKYAASFVQKFTGGTDQLGLVVFDGSAAVGYPSVRPWDSTITSTSTGGPSTAFMDGTSTDMLHMIAAIQAGGGTGMAEGLWLAYMELQKRHLKDQADPANNGVDNRLNSIVLFTDGVPSGLAMYLNNGAIGTADNSIKSTSPCTNKAIPATKMLGWFAVGGSPPYTGANGVGIYGLASKNTTDSALTQMGGPNADAVYATGTAFAGCGTTSPRGLFENIGDSTKTDLARIPTHDVYGNDLTGTAYTNSHIMDTAGHVKSVFDGTHHLSAHMTTVTDDYYWGLAMWNGVDSTANRIRNDVNQAARGDANAMGIAIYVIGYLGNSGGTDDGLLKRVANDKTSSSYNAAQQTGRYIPASDTNQLANAFDTLASIILRLSQ